MTPATKSKSTTKTQPTATAEEARHADALAEAKRELVEVQQRAQARDGRVRELHTRFLSRSIDAPEEFSKDTGTPKRGTEAAKFVEAIEEEARSDFSTSLHGAEQRVERAKRALVSVRTARARDLLLESLPEAEQIAAELVELAAASQGLLRRQHDLTHRNTTVCTESRAFDPRSVPAADHLAHLVGELAKAVPPRLPLPADLVAELRAVDHE